MSKFIKTLTLLLSLTICSYANANSIDILERERAKILNLILDKNISISERKKKIEQLQMRLLDLERMTINDKNLFN